MAERKPKAPPATQAEGDLPQKTEHNAIEVVAKCDSFRRAGRVFGRDPVQIEISALKEGELDLLQTEPMLAVQLIQLSEEA